MPKHSASSIPTNNLQLRSRTVPMLVTNPEKSPDSDADAPAPGAQSQQESQSVIGSTQGSVPGTPQLTVNADTELMLLLRDMQHQLAQVRAENRQMKEQGNKITQQYNEQQVILKQTQDANSDLLRQLQQKSSQNTSDSSHQQQDKSEVQQETAKKSDGKGSYGK